MADGRKDNRVLMGVLKAIFMLVLGAAIVWAMLVRFTGVVTRDPDKIASDRVGRQSEVQQLSNINLGNAYPGTADGVVKLFARLTKAIYNENYSDDEFEKLCMKRYELMDAELQDEQGSVSLYLKSMKGEADNKKKEGITISKYYFDDFDAAKDIYSLGDGRVYAQVTCRYVLRQNARAETHDYLFTMRQDTGSGKNWRILGWKEKTEDESREAVDYICSRNLHTDYPADPQSVVDFFAYITSTLYNETYTPQQLDFMGTQLAMLYDDELLANQADVQAQLETDIADKRNDGITVAQYVVDDPEDFRIMQVGSDICAYGKCMFSMRNEAARIIYTYDFVLRRDSSDRWKIFGWEVNEDE